MMRNKKGFYFIIDVVVGLSIIIVGGVFLLSYQFKVPLSTQPEFYSEDVVQTLSGSTYQDLSIDVARDWVSSGELGENEPFGAFLARACADNDFEKFDKLVNATVESSIKDHLGYSVGIYYLDDTICLNKTTSDIYRQNASPLVSVSQSIIMGLESKYDIVGPYVLEVKIW